MPVVTMKQLLEAGVHFGHQTKRWNPKMKRYIYAARNDIYIIDLQKTVVLAEEAYRFISKLSAEGKSILFVGTKKQASDAIKEEAIRCGGYYINSRWLGGTMTNFKTIKSRIERLNQIDQMEKMGEFTLLPKKEVASLKAERTKLETNLGGIRTMRQMPGALFIVDPKKEQLAVKEAKLMNIPIIGIVDTNCDPDEIDYVIPGNDDAIRAVKLIATMVADAVIEGRQGEAFEPAPKVAEEVVAITNDALIVDEAVAIAKEEALEEAAKPKKAKKVKAVETAETTETAPVATAEVKTEEVEA